MKKILATLLILCGIYSVTSAQQKNDVQFGVNVGLNLSTIDNSQDGFTEGYNNYLAGVNFAFSAEYYFSDRWSIKGKVIYDQKG
jgi:long-subunit fatty acid transport protein